MANVTAERFSFEAMHALAGRPTAGEFARRVGKTRRTVERWEKTNTIPEGAADQVAIAYDLHPANVWPAQW